MGFGDTPAKQLEAVKRIEKLENYYEILDVATDATVDKITKAYRKLSILVHPDKNKLPGATQAFQKLGQAYIVLTDPEKRRVFDEKPTFSFHFKNSDAERVFKDLFGDKELFTETEVREIFAQLARVRFRLDPTDDDQATEQESGGKGGGRNGKKKPKKKPRPTETWQQKENRKKNEINKTLKWAIIYTMMIFLIPIAASIWMYALPERQYSLEKNLQYRFPKFTRRLGVEYFVRDVSFLGNVDWYFAAFEDSIEAEHISKMKNECYQEINTRDSMMWKARTLSDRKSFKMAHHFKMAACDELYEYGIVM